MDVPAVFRSTSPEVLETHRKNVTRGRTATRKWRQFSEYTTLEPAIVYHPQGAIVTGAYPVHGTDHNTPPRGWFWDDARCLLAPALASDDKHGQAMLALLTEMEWVIDPLPGIDAAAALQGITCLDVDPDSARLEALAVLRGGGCAALESDGAVWLLLPHELSEAASPVHWERARRYVLEDALLEHLPLP